MKSGLLLILALITITTVAVFASGSGPLASRFRFDDLLAKLEAGEIGSGSHIDTTAGLAKPIGWVESKDADSVRYISVAYQYDHATLFLYFCDDVLFAAHHFVGVGPNRDKWYCYDRDKMAKYVATRM